MRFKKAKDANAAKEVVDPLEAQLEDLQFQQKTTELEIEKNKLQEEDLQNKQKDLIIYSSLGGIVKKVNKDTSQSTAQTAGDKRIQSFKLLQKIRSLSREH